MKGRGEKLMGMKLVSPVRNGLNPTEILRKDVEIASRLVP